jgi:Flp pilus assembly protein TadD
VLLEALALSPGNPAVLNNLGNVAYFRGDADRAVEFFTRAAESAESDGEIYINVAKAYLLKKDKAQAKAFYNKAVGINSDLAALYDYLAKEIQ